jgi:hypothetical protein
MVIDPKSVEVNKYIRIDPIILLHHHSLFCMHYLEPEEEDYLFCPSFDWDDLFPEETFGDRLQLFYNQFNSSTRALLSDSLFRENESHSILQGISCTNITSLEILCGNDIIYKRLIQKHQKIGNQIRWIWPDTVTQFSICVRTPEWWSQIFYLQ